MPTSDLTLSTEEGRMGADESQFNVVKVALDAMGKASFFFGPVGQVYFLNLEAFHFQKGVVFNFFVKINNVFVILIGNAGKIGY